MANAENWQEILKYLIPAVITAVATLLVAFLNILLPRLWQDDLRRLQSESETRVKRFEAVEKGLSVVTRAKADFGIEISTHDLQSELQRIVHELADPVVLSREALEDWAKKSFGQRIGARPRFNVPIEYARAVRFRRRTTSFVSLLSFLWGLQYFFIIIMTEHEYFSKDFLANWGNLFLYGGYAYFLFLYILNESLIYRAHRAALKMLRGIPESPMAEVAKPPSRYRAPTRRGGLMRSVPSG
jgi:hypothetical protein